jgi:hypothetical protein
LHISPRTVEFLTALGHDVVRVNAVLAANSADESIVAFASREQRTILTRFGFLSDHCLNGGKAAFTDYASAVIFPDRKRERGVAEDPAKLEQDALTGMIITVEDDRIRRRSLPIS